MLILSGLKNKLTSVKSEQVNGVLTRFMRSLTSITTAALIGASVLIVSAPAASAENRTLKLQNLHTGEKIIVTFKRNGSFDPRALKELNVFLRDWRRNEPTKMDPRLFDLIWSVYQKTGSSEYIHVLCGYRSPTTNNMLRSRSKGVAEKSQHVLGRAMDYYIPGVNLSKLREIGVKMQVGGVGFYPKSGSPFVHMDVGSVRAWPRLSHEQLARLFPDGKTVHIPADGRPLPGYNQAVAENKRRASSGNIQIADVSEDAPRKKRGFLASLFGGGDEADEVDAEAVETRVAAKAPAKAVAKPVVDEVKPILASLDPTEQMQQQALVAPVPSSRPAFGSGNDGIATQTALVSPTRSAAQDALSAAMPSDIATASTPAPAPFVDLAQYAVPVPQLLGVRQQNGDAEMVASADPNGGLSGIAVPVPGMRPETPASSENLAALAAIADTKPVVPAEKPVELAMLDPKPAAVMTAAPALAAPQAVMSALNPPVEPLVSVDADAADTADAVDDEDLTDIAALDPSMINNPANEMSDAAKFAELPSGDVKKGSRPGKTRSLKIGDTGGKSPKLTQNALAKWAITKGLVPTAVSAQKAPRVVAQALVAPAKAGETSGFKTNVANIDTQRFGGDTEEQMDMSRFATN